MADKENKRFATINEDDLAELQRTKDSKSTQRIVSRAIRMFKDFLGEESGPIEEMSKQTMNQKLRLFYASVRKTDGSELKKKSLDSLKYGVSKYLKDKCGIDVKEVDFLSSHEMYKARQFSHLCNLLVL